MRREIFGGFRMQSRLGLFSFGFGITSLYAGLTGERGMDFATIIVLFLALVFYLLPSAIANKRETDHVGSIFLVNLLFGWTVLGWIAALIWAIVEKPTNNGVLKMENG